MMQNRLLQSGSQMECPFLKKINFKKVNQISSGDQDLLECPEPEPLSAFVGEQNFDFQEETMENINDSNINPRKLDYFNSKITAPLKTRQKLMIRFPKEFQAKKMMMAYPLPDIEQTQNEDSILNQQSISSMQVPHALISNISRLTQKCEEIFQGEVTVGWESTVYYCQLKDHVIKISKEDKLKYFIDMEKADCFLDEIEGKKGKLLVMRKGKDLKINLMFASGQKLLGFVKALKLNKFEIQDEKGCYQDELQTSSSIDSLGYSVERMAISKILEQGDTFDIILFKNKNWMSKVQRIFTNSDYDHVAMLLKTSSQQVFLLESTSNSGVSIYPFQSLVALDIKKYYIRMGYRKYKGERDSKEILQLQLFLREALGKRYKFDPMYLISSEPKKQDTYFCSQLVAAALQKSGLMNCSSQAYKYLPKHFSTDFLNNDIINGHYSQTIILQ